MKNKASIVLISIKTNNEIVEILKFGKKFNLPFATLWFVKQANKSQVKYALLVNKTQFKLAVTRNKVKRQLRSVLMSSEIKGGIQVLIKPISTYLKKDYSYIKENIVKTINKYQNGK